MEIVAERTEYSQTFDNQDGSKTTQFFMEPVFYAPTDGSALEPIAVSFAPSADGYRSTKAPVAVSVSESSSSNDFVTTTYGTNTIGFRLAASSGKGIPVAPVVDGTVADYENVLPGVGLRVIANAHGAKSFFVWNASPPDASISYVVDAPGLMLKAQSDGSIGIFDAGGALTAAIPVPYAVDSTIDPLTGGGKTTNAVRLTLAADGKTVTVGVDEAWLKTATYPVYVDPSTGWIYNAGSSSYGDAFIDSVAPTTNFGDYQRPDTPFYHELWNGVSPADAGNVYDFLRWDLSTYAGVTVDAASLKLYPYHQYYNAPLAETTYVRRVTSSWT